MNILFVSSRFLYPPIQGDRVRGYHFLRLLSKRHKITLVTPAASPLHNQRVAPQLCERWVSVHIPKWQPIAHLSRFPFSALPLQTLYFCPPTIQKRVQTLFQAESFDLVHVQLARMGPAVNGLNNVPKVLDFIDALSLNMRRRGMQERWPLKWLFNLEARRMACYERILLRSFDQQTISSPLDRVAIGDFESLHVIPNGVNLEEFPYRDDKRENNAIVFSGRMSYFPNAHAAVFFAREVFPLIHHRVSQARFLIVGADPSRQVRQLANLQGVEVTGYVPRIQDYLAIATVAVAPMQAGSGMQFKVLEAMATGTPVVATPDALGGIAARDGEHLLVAKDARSFAEQVLRLLQDAALRGRLAHNARRLVEQKYTWERSVARLEEVYRLAAQAE